MKQLILPVIITVILISSACGTKQQTSAAGSKPGSTESKFTAASNSNPAAAENSPSSVVKDIYGDAMRRNCSMILPKLTEEVRKSVGTGKDALEALCDTFTDSGKLASFEIKGEEIKSDSATVKIAMTYKDGKNEAKEERLKRSGDKWLMDS